MLLVFGSINLDISFRAPGLPAPGQTVLGSGYLVSPGGKGANQAHAARLDGAEVCLAGAVGDDAFAGAALRLLREAGVNLDAVRVTPEPTGCAGIVVDAQGENQIVVAPGANLAAREAEVGDALLRRARAVLLQMETDPAQNVSLLRRAHAAGCLTLLNNAPARALEPAWLQALDVLVVNEGEFVTATAGLGIAGGDLRARMAALMAHPALAARATGSTAAAPRDEFAVVLTLGARGGLACVMQGGALRWHEWAAPSVTVVDTTGAGDTFTGVLAASLAGGNARTSRTGASDPAPRDWPRALRRAAAAAALACTRAGAQQAQPGRAATDALLGATGAAR